MGSDTIWSDMKILHSKAEHIDKLLEIDKRTAEVYDELANHLKTISLSRPSKVEVIAPLFGKFDDINTEIDRALLNLYIYISYIRVKHLDCNMQADHMSKITTLLTMLSEQRRCLVTADYSDFFEHLTDQKDKSSENYYPYLALLERKSFKALLNGLMGIKMIVNFVVKHLEKCDHILDSLDIKIKSGVNLYF